MIFQEDSFPEDLPSFSLNNTDLRRLCAREASRFSYSKSTWTFPLYKKSVNWQNRTMEKPWGMMGLFNVSDHNRWTLQVADLSEKRWFCLNYFSEFTPPETVTQTCMWSQVVFLTVNHHGPVPLRELHSTDDKRSSVERPWGILSPFSTRFRLQVNSSFQGLFVTQTYYYVASLWSRSFFLWWITADPSPWGNFTPPTKQ